MMDLKAEQEDSLNICSILLDLLHFKEWQMYLTELLILFF